MRLRKATPYSSCSISSDDGLAAPRKAHRTCDQDFRLYRTFYSFAGWRRSRPRRQRAASHSRQNDGNKDEFNQPTTLRSLVVVYQLDLCCSGSQMVGELRDHNDPSVDLRHRLNPIACGRVTGSYFHETASEVFGRRFRTRLGREVPIPTTPLVESGRSRNAGPARVSASGALGVAVGQQVTLVLHNTSSMITFLVVRAQTPGGPCISLQRRGPIAAPAHRRGWAPALATSSA